MATGITVSGTSNLSSGQRILVANAKKAFEPSQPDPDLVSNERIPLGHKTWDILTYARLADASALTEGVDLTQTQQLVTASLSIEPSEHGVIATLSKRLIRRQGDANVMVETGTMIANSLRRRQAKDIVAIYDTYTKTIVGASVALDITYFRGAVAYLLTDNDSGYGPAPMPVHASLHIEQISDIILDISDPGTAAGSRPAGFGDDILQNWWRGRDRLYGVSVFHSGVIVRDASGDAKGAIFHPSSIHLVMANEAEATVDDDPSARLKEFGVFQEWGEGLRADPHGLEVYSDTVATV